MQLTHPIKKLFVIAGQNTNTDHLDKYMWW